MPMIRLAEYKQGLLLLLMDFVMFRLSIYLVTNLSVSSSSAISSIAYYSFFYSLDFYACFEPPYTDPFVLFLKKLLSVLLLIYIGYTF